MSGLNGESLLVEWLSGEIKSVTAENSRPLSQTEINQELECKIMTTIAEYMEATPTHARAGSLTTRSETHRLSSMREPDRHDESGEDPRRSSYESTNALNAATGT